MSTSEIIDLFRDTAFAIVKNLFETIRLRFDLSGATSGTMTLRSSHTANRSLLLQDRDGTIEVVESKREAMTGDTIDYSTKEIVYLTLSSNETLVITNPVQGKVLVLELTPAGFTLNLPAECIVISGRYKTTTVNYIYFHCVSDSPAKYIVTIGQQLA